MTGIRQGRFTLVPTPFDDPVADRLIAAVQQEYVARYGGGDATPVDPVEFAPPDGLFLVGYLDGEPVASGGYRRYDTTGAELKRMYVARAVRGRGLSRQVLAALEEAAAAAGYRRLVLETGDRQPEAIGLYRTSGYHPVPGFGVYAADPASVCFGKDLTGPAG